MDKKFYKFNVSISGYLHGESKEYIEEEIVRYLKAWNDNSEDFSIDEMLVDEVENDIE